MLLLRLIILSTRFNGSNLVVGLQQEPRELIVLLFEGRVGSREENDRSLELCEYNMNRVMMSDENKLCEMDVTDCVENK